MTDAGLQDVSAKTRISRLAVVALVAGIAAVVGSLAGIGPILGVVAIGLSAVAIGVIKRKPLHLAGLGYAQAGLVLGLLAIPLGLVDPALHKAHDFNGPACQANITGMIKGFIVYANDNNDVFPTPGFPLAPRGYSTDLGVESVATDPDAALLQIPTTVGAHGNPLTAMWMLVLRNQETPKNLICRSDPYANSTPSPLTHDGVYLLSPAARGQVSYSIAYPYASATKVGDWWKGGALSDVAVMSDIAPLNRTGRPKRDLAALGTPRDGATVNSGNHNGQGQNVGYNDGHCQWKTTPLAGQNGDNIWTVGTAASPARSYGGGVIAGGGVPNYPPTDKESAVLDTIMVPVRDLDSGAIK